MSCDTNPEKLGLDYKRIFQILRHGHIPNLTRNVKKSMSRDIITEEFRGDGRLVMNNSQGSKTIAQCASSRWLVFSHTLCGPI
jgi:hypothetical protein